MMIVMIRFSVLKSKSLSGYYYNVVYVCARQLSVSCSCIIL
jgi:hypothetical protein